MSRRPLAAILAAVLVLAAAAHLDAAEDGDKALAEARALVEKKAYGEALALYERIADFLSHDPGLLMEWARVYAYADRHPEAIRLFEQIRKDHPDRAREFLRELGDQYLWDGQPDKAEPIYREALAINPLDSQAALGLARVLSWSGRRAEAATQYDQILKYDPGNLAALNGKAEVLSWMDRLEEAYDLYGQVLARDPSNLEARNGQARVRVWQGYHRAGTALYEKTLEEHPNDLDALEGLAFARHWNDRDDLATPALAKLLALKPDRREAGKLNYHIQYARQPYVTQSNLYWKDKNDLSLQSHGVRTGFRPTPLTNLEGIQEWVRLRQPGQPTVEGNRGGLSVASRFSDAFQFHSYLFGTHFSRVDFNPFTTNTWFTYEPDDLWRFDLSYDRQTFDDIGALRNHIFTDSGSLSADFRPNRFWLFSAKYQRSEYSDTNEQNTVLAKVEYRLLRDPYVKLYYNYYYSDWAKQLYHGYFNPQSIRSHSLGVYASKNITEKLFAEGQLSAGHEHHNPIADQPTFYAGGGLVYRLSPRWLASLRGEYFEARPDNDSGSNGYRRKTIMLSITYNFGEAAPDRGTPSVAPRPITGR